MLVVFVHGWGVREPHYGSLPDQIREALGATILDIWLSEYISYCDDITMDDLALAFERARMSHFPDRDFACITHSTGGPVMRTWLDRYPGPMKALVMLAPPNHGSALAHLGKGRLSRLKSWVEGVEPGQRILDWLELGSEDSWDLNLRWIETESDCRMLVVCGATPDRSLYDHLNSYTGESGSDGVVRLAAANLNYSLMRLRQSGQSLELVADQRSPETPFLILPGASHAGILNLESTERISYAACMLIFKVSDSAGNAVNDYDFLLTAGPENSPDALPKGFFIDRQRNSLRRNMLTYFLNYTALHEFCELGFTLIARPSVGPVNFAPASFRSTILLRPHETVMIEVTLTRLIERRVFQCLDGIQEKV